MGKEKFIVLTKTKKKYVRRKSFVNSKKMYGTICKKIMFVITKDLINNRI